MFDINNLKIAVIGMGYVGLPLAVEFGAHFDVIGFDINDLRIDELRLGIDRTLEVDTNEFIRASKLTFTTDYNSLNDCNFYIITVPTPIDDYNRPDLRPLIKASKMISKILNKGDIVVYESTVYPGATEEICVPILEAGSSLKFNVDFYCGYSPERINPGDKFHRLITIKKITSGSNEDSAEFVDLVYRKIIVAGTHRASSIKVAEAAKVIENTQRDLNISLMNELSLIFDRLNIDTMEVLEAAKTKWNFLPFTPGLVGGHCIGVDPYYLTHKAEHVGYHPQVILAGRRINDAMGEYIGEKTVKMMARKKIPLSGAKVLVLGLTFKENCPDLRNTKVIDIIKSLESYCLDVDVYDPWVDLAEAKSEYGIECLKELPTVKVYSAIIIAVSHNQFEKMGIQKIRNMMDDQSVLFDVKALFPREFSDCRL